jgi:integrase
MRRNTFRNASIIFVRSKFIDSPYQPALNATEPAKQRGKKREQIVEIVKIGPELDALLTRLEAVRPERECLYVFPTRDGNQYTDHGFKTLWQRCVLEAIEKEILSTETRFTFHDLRAYYASKHKRDRGVLPDLHANPETTARVYDRNKEVGRDSF